MRTLAEMAPGTIQWRRALNSHDWTLDLGAERVAAIHILPPILAPRANGELFGRSWSLAPRNLMQTRLVFTYAADSDESIEYTRPPLRWGWVRGSDGGNYRFKQTYLTHDVVLSNEGGRRLLATQYGGSALVSLSLSEEAREEASIDRLVLLALYLNLTAWSGGL